MRIRNTTSLAIPSGPIRCHVPGAPPEPEKKTPLPPGAPARCRLGSPPPAKTSLGLAGFTATAPKTSTDRSSDTRSPVLPPLFERHRPPTVETKRFWLFWESIATPVTRPLMFVGPAEVQTHCPPVVGAPPVAATKAPGSR